MGSWMSALHGAELLLKCTLKQQMGAGHLTAHKPTGLQVNSLHNMLPVKSCFFHLLFFHITYIVHIYLFICHINQHNVIML